MATTGRLGHARADIFMSRSAFAAALSEHPLATQATGEVLGAVIEEVGLMPDLAMVFVTKPHAGALEDIVSAIDDLLHPLVLLGCASGSVLGGEHEVEDSAAISLWAGRTGPVLPVRIEMARESPLGPLLAHGWPDRIAFEPSALVLMADPFSFDVEAFLSWLATHHPGLPVVGGMASGGTGPGGTRISSGRSISSSGAVGAILGPGVEVATVVSQGSRPFGHPLVVTRAERNVIYELAGRPAIERIVTQAHETLSSAELTLLEHGGLNLGRVIDEHAESFGRGDFLVRGLLASDRRTGSITVTEAVPVGTTVQLHLRDAAAAHEDLDAMLRGHHAAAAIVFTCNGRGTRMFDMPDHDIASIRRHLGPAAVAGCFAAGELGPVGGRNFLHSLTASMLLLDTRA